MNPATLARRFSILIRAYLTAEQLAEVVRRNGTAHESVCHSHDFCDANEVMAEAFAGLTGRSVDGGDDEDTELWGMAWALAKKANFNP